METKDLIAKAHTSIALPTDKVWEALTNPRLIKKYMFGATVTSNWEKGSDITWKGEWNGKKYEDKGKIIDIIPGEKLSYSHYSPLSGLPDKPANYHTVTIHLKPEKDKTSVTLVQDNNSSEKEQKESEKNWNAMLEGLKKLLESKDKVK